MSLIIQLLSAITAVTALLLIWCQLRCQTKQMRFDALTDLHKLLITEDMQKALRFVYGTNPVYLAKPKYTDHLRMIELVLNTYDLIGFRVKKGVLPKKATLETEWKILLSIWSQLKKFIDNKKTARGIPYKEYFIWLVEEARKRHPHYEPIIEKIELQDEYKNPKPCVGILLLQNKSVLLGLRAIEPYKNHWDIPGGFVDEGEHPMKAAIREFKEETNLSIKEPKDLLGIFMDIYRKNDESTMNLCYVVQEADGEMKAASDVAKLKWFPLDNLPVEEEMAFKWEKKALDQLKKRNYTGYDKS